MIVRWQSGPCYGDTSASQNDPSMCEDVLNMLRVGVCHYGFPLTTDVLHHGAAIEPDHFFN